ncbi:MAG: PAS domain-containing protein [Bacteroidota bacterium]
MRDTPLTQEQMVLNTIINNIPAMVFYKDLEGIYIAANEMFCHQLKTTPSEIIGKTDFDFYDKARATRYRDTDLEIVKSDGFNEGFEEEIQIDGETRIFATRKVLLKDHQGKPYGIIGLAYDVTENRRAGQKLAESQARYKSMYDMFRLMADNIPDLLWAKDLQRRYIFANKAICEKVLGANDTEEPIGKTDLFFAERERISHHGDLEWHTFGEICSDSDELTMQQKAPAQFDESGNIKGEFLYLDVQKAPLMDENGNMLGTVGSGRDITKQKQMEREFQALYKRNQAIIKSIPDLMFLFDKDGKYLDCYVSNFNDLLAQPDILIGKNVKDFVSSEIAEKTLEAIARCLQSESVQTFEYEVLQGTINNHYEARFNKVDEHQVLCISRNITERKTLQHELIEAKEKAEESSRLKSILLNNISHELRTPLNGILGFSEIMVNELKDSDYIDMASHINNSGKRLMKTLDSIMQLSQLESGINALHIEEYEVEKSFRQLLNNFIPNARAKGLFFEIRNISAIRGYIDVFFFTQAISNILENAIKFTNEGGVAIEVFEEVVDSERILNITIEDTGIGISEAHLKLIFEEFRQASEGQNRSFEGTGLGLTIARKMIQLLGGKIFVTSKMGKGSVFNILIPFSEFPGFSPHIPVDKPSEKETKKPLEYSVATPTVLLVEDNEVNSQLTFAYLKNEYKVEWAIDCVAALEMVKKKKYDAILMDINLGPGMDGLNATHLIRKIKGYENLPIIALTGYTMFGDKERLIAGGCTDYIPKPFSRTEILNLLNRILKS